MSKRPRRQAEQLNRPEAVDLESTWRLFLAFPLPDEVKTHIELIEASPAIADLPLRFVDPSLAHVTLHFLGATPPERAELIALSLRSALGGLRAADVATGQLGLFPGARKPRVLWLGLGGETAQLEVIHQAAGRALEKTGVELEPRAFQPHITIGRLRNEPPAGTGEQIAQAITSQEAHVLSRHEPIRFRVGEVHLMRSHLEKAGPRYELFRVFRLNSS